MRTIKNILLRVPYVVLLVLPYVFAIVFNIWLKAETTDDAGDKFMGIMVTFSLIGALVVCARMIISSTIMSFRESSIWNLVTKIIYLPAHIYLFSLCSFGSAGFNGFVVLIWLILFLASFDLMRWTAAANIAACAKGHDDGKLKLGTTVIMMILSFVYVADIVVAVVQVVKSSRRKI